MKKISRKQPLNEYSKLMIQAIENIDKVALDKVVNRLWLGYKEGKTIFFAGNGGSASMASHIAADLGKNTARDHQDKYENRVRVASLCENVTWITAVSNDTSYDNVFVEQLKSLAMAGDILVIISGSGNSMNIIKAAMWARENKLYTIGILGFDGGFIRNILDLSIVVDSFNYGIVESMHAFLHHYIVEEIKNRKKVEKR